MKTVHITPAGGYDKLVEATDEGTVILRQVEHWAIVEFDRVREPDDYARGQSWIPVIMTPAGPKPIVEKIGASRYLGYQKEDVEGEALSSWKEKAREWAKAQGKS